MAEKRGNTAASPDRPTRQDFISAIVPDPAAPPLLWILSGYLGASSRENHTRLYLSPDLSLWADIPEEAVAHTERLPGELNLLGAVLVWVRRDARLVSGYASLQPAR